MQFALLVTSYHPRLLPGCAASPLPSIRRRIPAAYGRNRIVSFLNEVRNSAANCGSLFWMYEFGNHVYASYVPPMRLNVYGAV